MGCDVCVVVYDKMGWIFVKLMDCDFDFWFLCFFFLLLLLFFFVCWK